MPEYADLKRIAVFLLLLLRFRIEKITSVITKAFAVYLNSNIHKSHYQFKCCNLFMAKILHEKYSVYINLFIFICKLYT